MGEYYVSFRVENDIVHSYVQCYVNANNENEAMEIAAQQFKQVIADGDIDLAYNDCYEND